MATATFVAASASLFIPHPPKILPCVVPQMGGEGRSGEGLLVGPVGDERGNGMKVVRRIAIALGSLLAVALAGGAHWRG